MKNNLKLALIFCLIFFNIKTACAITLSEAVKSAYENNYDIKAQKSSYEASQSLKSKSIVGGFLPSVSVDVNTGHQKTKIGESQKLSDSINKKSLNVSQEVFNGGGTIFDIKRTSNLSKREKYLLENKEQETVLSVIKFYSGILKYSALLKLEEENINSYQKILEYTKKRKAAKDATVSDLARAEADYISAVNNKTTILNNLNSTKASFSKVIGVEYDQVAPLAEFSEPKIDVKFNDLLKINLVETALNNNPQLLATKHSYEASRFETMMTKSELLPTAKVSYSIEDSNKSVYLNNQSQRNNSIFLNVHVPIFSTGAEYYNIGYARNKQNEEKYNYESVRTKVIESASLYLNEMKNADSSYKSSKEAESANEVYYNAVAKEEKYGTKSIIDLLIAKQQFHKSQLDRINFYYDKIFAIFQLEYVAGNLRMAD